MTEGSPVRHAIGPNECVRRYLTRIVRGDDFVERHRALVVFSEIDGVTRCGCCGCLLHGFMGCDGGVANRNSWRLHAAIDHNVDAALATANLSKATLDLVVSDRVLGFARWAGDLQRNAPGVGQRTRAKNESPRDGWPQIGQRAWPLGKLHPRWAHLLSTLAGFARVSSVETGLSQSVCCKGQLAE